MDSLEHKLIGDGDTNVIFLNGFRMRYDSWDKVYPSVAESSKVLLLNRAGVGSSAKAQVPQTGNVVTDSIRNTASQAGMKPPYVLVSHSLGGIFANLYARLFPAEVAGVVFVEAPHPLEIIEQKKIQPPLLLRALNDGAKRLEKLFDKYKFSEDECIYETIHQLEAAGEFPDIPVSVVTGGKKMPIVPQQAFDLHVNFQAKLLELSGQSKQFVCEHSGHFPQITESDAVVAAIEHSLGLIRGANRSMLNTCAK
ncbi:alpha/beta fold hydrolase [Marinimicrobium sp. ABcell2]|uniref:alpha/beta fold hydrolase n=1 Tax=Marinimicrobium sp. ABcell2 TaxID=3069751 RepID=UPI0027B77CD5|nr:alpha/beta hydrolase [Marinimicrobium sp. ABcell2]MDQ2077982.1 alpha/beta hydrolase [Marinimicrobium sp. ABcell2]